MRLRAKLFLIWACIMLVLWAGAFWSIHRAVKLRVDQMAQDAFGATQRGLEGMQREHVARMQQAGRLILRIPELRALIADRSIEVTPKNRGSLKERLDSLESVADINFATVLDRDGRSIEKSEHSPWSDVETLSRYCISVPQSIALLRGVYSPATGKSEARYGIWAYAGKLYQVVAIPLTFQEEDGVQGALLLGEQISDPLADDLGRSHNSHVTFFANGAVVASSLSPGAQSELAAMNRQGNWAATGAFTFHLDNTLYHGSIQPVKDPSSDTVVGQMLIQCDQQDGAVEKSILRSLSAIMLSGLLLAGIGSYLVSGAITRPVRSLVAGVQRVAGGDLDLSLPIRGRDELSELSASFNDMVNQLRSRRELEKQFEQARAASTAKSHFLANMSHEIRTPLNGVIGMTELLMGTQLTDQQRRFAALVKTSAELLTTQINDILDFSKIEAGKLELETIDFNLHEVVESVVDLLSEKASKKKLEVACHFQSEVPRHVRGDPDRLRQILVNLINNAIKFTSSGSIVVRIVPHEEQGDQTIIRISVTDTGIGIPPERMDRLFKPFSQVDASTTRKFGGTGLGLAIAKQLSELMGGQIGLQSTPGQGSTFWFTVKLTRAEAPQSISPRPIDARSLRVLAVDDSQTTRAILEEQLASWGVEAQTSGTASGALEMLRAAVSRGQPYKVVIVDSDMPGTSGFELARMIKADPQISSTVLIALLPIEASIGAQQLREVGFAGHMTKPVRQSQLFDGIMRAVAKEHASALRSPDPTAPVETATRAQVSGRILIAEDNDVNQVVVVELLRKAGHECHVVDNGRDAVDAAMSGEYDLVLMDCQMPVMDGFQATRIIRQKESERSRPRLPIIALTANAIKGDREECLAAGMDNYCGKPVDARQLLSQIDSLLKHLPPRQQEPVRQEAPASSDVPAIIVDELIARCMNNPTTLETVMQKFEKQAMSCVQEIRQSLAQSNVSEATRTAHSLKGSASIVAAQSLRNVAAEIERLGRSDQSDQMQQMLAQLDEEVRRCVEYLPHVRQQASARLTALAGK